MQFKHLTVCAVVLSASLLDGCASIISGGPRTVTISSTPSGVPFVIKNKAGVEVSSGTTPSTQTLLAKAGFFQGQDYSVVYKPQGGTEATRPLNSSLNGWYWGNIIFGGLIGMLIVDPATGAMWNLPTSVAADIPQAPAAEAPVTAAPPATEPVVSTALK